MKNSLGTLPLALSRASSPSVRPVSGSVCVVSWKGNRFFRLYLFELDGWPKRWLNSPRPPPATSGIIPS